MPGQARHDDGKCDGAQIFRHRRHPGGDQHRADDGGDGDEGRHGGRRLLPARRAQAPRADRQGHPPVGLHARIGIGGGVHVGRHGRGDGRADADAGGGDADPVDACRHRRDDLRQPQSLCRQRHQAVRPRRLQALGRRRSGDRGTDRRRRAARRVGPDRPRAPRRRRAGPLHPLRQVDLSLRPDARRAEGRDRLRQRGRLQGRAVRAVGTRRRCDRDRRDARRHQHQPSRRLDRAADLRGDGGRVGRGHRHRAGRRRRPADRRRRTGARGRRRPVDGDDRRRPRAGGDAQGRRAGRDRDVEPGAGAASGGAGAGAPPHQGRRPSRAGGDGARAASTSAASSRDISSCRTMRPPATAWSRRCRSSPN